MTIMMTTQINNKLRFQRRKRKRKAKSEIQSEWEKYPLQLHAEMRRAKKEEGKKTVSNTIEQRKKHFSFNLKLNDDVNMSRQIPTSNDNYVCKKKEWNQFGSVVVGHFFSFFFLFDGRERRQTLSSLCAQSQSLFIAICFCIFHVILFVSIIEMWREKK